jgi:hypothetical protein
LFFNSLSDKGELVTPLLVLADTSAAALLRKHSTPTVNIGDCVLKGKIMRLRSVALFVVLGLALAVSPAFGDVFASTFDNLTGQSLGNGPFTLGWRFTINTPITVNWLDLFDDSQDGLAVSHGIGIWDAGGTLLVSGTVAGGTADPLHNQFRAVAVTPTLLAAGDYRIGAVFLDGSDNNLFPGYATNFATASQIAFVENAFVAGGALANPTNTAGADPAYFGPNFEFDAVPEPSAILLLGTAALLTGMSFRRRSASSGR